MWVNVFNSCDRELMQRHLDTYYDRNVVVTQNDVREGKPDISVRYLMSL